MHYRSPDGLCGLALVEELDAASTLTRCLALPDSYFRLTEEALIPAAPVAVENNSGVSLKPTNPALLPPDEGGVFPMHTRDKSVTLSNLADATCYPGGVIFLSDGRVFVESFRTSVEHGNLNLGQDRRSAAESRGTAVVEEPSIFLDGENFSQWGHFFGEVFSRLWIGDYVDIRDFKIAVGAGYDASHIKELLTLAGVSQSQIILVDRRTKFRSLLVPSQSHVVRVGFSDIGQNFYQRIARQCGDVIRLDRVYVSRRLVKRRALLNENDVETYFRRQGFDVVMPETLTVAGQLSLFANARYIAGVSGSNLFGALVAGKVERKYILSSSSYLLHNDVVFNRFANSDITYYVERSEGVMHDWTAQVPLVKQSVARWCSGL